MNEHTVFQAALAITDLAERSSYLDRACAGNAKLRQQVEALLAADARSRKLLDNSAHRQMADNPDETRTFGEKANEEKFDLSFLTPSAKPGSLGSLGHYEVMQVLGQGGFGTVLKAFDEKLHRMVAIKVLSRQLAATSPPRKRFLREARAVAAIKHENVVQVYSVEEQPLPYLVMEFVDGSTLQDKMDEAGPLGVPEILHLGRQIAAGLAAAHSLGLIHRDIKPANILLEQGAAQKVKITDFGLARTADDASLTQSGTIAGTPLYMAPEQAKAAKLDSRADLFSLGSVLYALTSGHSPFRAPTTLAVLRRVAEDTPRPLQEIIPETPDWLVAIIDKLLAKDPDERFQTAQEVADLLALCQSKLHAGVAPTAASLGLKPATVEPVSTATVKAEQKRKKFPVAGVAAGILLMFAVMAAGLFFLNKNKGDGNVAVVPPAKPDDPPVEVVPATFKNSIGMEFVKVPKGTGWLGGGAGKPGQTKVVIEQDFYLGKYEVTQGEWEAVTGLNPSHFSRTGAGKDAVKGIPDADLKRFPVESVSWDDCQLFIKRLNEKEKDTGWVYRLPKETEWEYACRGGPVDKLDSAFNFYFAKPTNTLLSESANFDEMLKRTCKVGSYPPNVLGLHDMHGNNWEWCLDEDVPNDPATRRINRGGGWPGDTLDCFVTKAYAAPPSYRNNCLGLRLARVPAGTAVAVPATTDPERKAAFNNTIGMEFVKVPKGTGWLGGGAGKQGETKVVIDQDFYLGKYEVTQEEWEKVTGLNPSHFSRTGAGKDAVKGIPDADLKRFPVESVSWDDCQLFIKRLNEKEKDTGWVYRLPKGAEWEYACRGGPVDKLDSAFDFYFAKPTNTLKPEMANFWGRGLQHTCRVGSFESNILGVCDLHGSIWEWCEDTTAGTMSVPHRFYRGGAWDSDYENSRTSLQKTAHPSTRSNNLGLRLARVPVVPAVAAPATIEPKR